MYMGGKKNTLGLQASLIVSGSTWDHITCKMISHSWNFVPPTTCIDLQFFSFLNATLTFKIISWNLIKFVNMLLLDVIEREYI